MILKKRGGDKVETVQQKVKIDTSDLDKTIRKIEKLNALLKEDSSLANELASKHITVTCSSESLV